MKLSPSHHIADKSTSRQSALARLDSLGPCVIELLVTGIPALLEPIAVTSATALFARFFGSATLEAHGNDSFGRQFDKRRYRVP